MGNPKFGVPREWNRNLRTTAHPDVPSRVPSNWADHWIAFLPVAAIVPALVVTRPGHFSALQVAGWGAAITAIYAAIFIAQRIRSYRYRAKTINRVYDESDLQEAAKEFPDVDRIISGTQGACTAILTSPAMTQGWLPISERDIRLTEWSIVDRAMKSLPGRQALSDAEGRPAVRSLAATANAEIIASDEQLKHEVERLTQIASSARAISNQLEDLEIAEKLGALSLTGLKDRTLSEVNASQIDEIAGAIDGIRQTLDTTLNVVHGGSTTQELQSSTSAEDQHRRH